MELDIIEKRKAPVYRQQAQDEPAGRLPFTFCTDWLVTSSRWRLELEKEKQKETGPELNCSLLKPNDFYGGIY
ncbi:hypothetical protein [Bacillus marasmi]|uniref:hypothetical protein n=1 Tax=Bacillus marasmi TaxID=1926279 RepID=UPI0011CB8043|nr:hypothetical protein [Bacillus marasmi]